MIRTDLTPAIAYLRHSVAPAREGSTVGNQRAAILAFANDSDYEIIAEFSDDASSHTDVVNRSGFAGILKRIEMTGVNTIIVATADCFDDDPFVQAIGYAKLRQYGINLIAVDDPNTFVKEPPTGRLVDQIFEVAATFDRGMKAANLRAVGERLRTKFGPKRRKTYSEMLPHAVVLAKRLHHESSKTVPPLSLRAISAQLARAGHVQRGGKPYHPEAISRMIKGPRPRLGKKEP